MQCQQSSRAFEITSSTHPRVASLEHASQRQSHRDPRLPHRGRDLWRNFGLVDFGNPRRERDSPGAGPIILLTYAHHARRRRLLDVPCSNSHGVWNRLLGLHCCRRLHRVRIEKTSSFVKSHEINDVTFGAIFRIDPLRIFKQNKIAPVQNGFTLLIQ